MHNLTSSIFADLHPFIWLMIWCWLICLPLIALSLGVYCLRKKSLGIGITSLVVGIVFVVFEMILFSSMGVEMVENTIEAGGRWVISVIISGLVCILLFPYCYVGAQLRYAYNCKIKGYRGSKENRSMITGVVGLIMISGIGFIVNAIYHSYLNRYIIGALILIVIGWFGRTLVPDLE